MTEFSFLDRQQKKSPFVPKVFCGNDNELITTLVIYSSPMNTSLIRRLSSHSSKYFSNVWLLQSHFSPQVCVCVYLCEHEGDCLVCFVFARPHSEFLYVLIVYWWLKTSIIHGHPAMQQGDSDSISHLRSEGFNPLSMNNHSSLKSICFEYVTQIKLYRKDAVTW